MNPGAIILCDPSYAAAGMRYAPTQWAMRSKAPPNSIRGLGGESAGNENGCPKRYGIGGKKDKTMNAGQERKGYKGQRAHGGQSSTSNFIGLLIKPFITTLDRRLDNCVSRHNQYKWDKAKEGQNWQRRANGLPGWK